MTRSIRSRTLCSLFLACASFIGMTEYHLLNYSTLGLNVVQDPAIPTLPQFRMKRKHYNRTATTMNYYPNNSNNNKNAQHMLRKYIQPKQAQGGRKQYGKATPRRTGFGAFHIGPGSEIIPKNKNKSAIFEGPEQQQQQAKDKSTVDYFACCGLGHRMSKMVDANYIAKYVNFGFRAFWGFCGKVEVFHYFFGPQPSMELQNITSTGLSLKINNESPDFGKFARDGNEQNCQQCPKDNYYAKESFEFYERLRNRFRARNAVTQFRNTNFANHTVIGLHVRAGNGEGGDFMKKNRGIQNADTWMKSVTQLLVEMSSDWDPPPLLFIATDTASIIEGFQRHLNGKMPITYLQQSRVAQGMGVAFGEAGNVASKGKGCLEKWENSLMDMMILSHADVVVAGRPSSFTQSLPMSTALSKSDRRIRRSYCEVHPDGTKYKCYEGFHDWCCRGKTEFHLEGIRGYEYLRMPRTIEMKDIEHLVVPRPPRNMPLPDSNSKAFHSFLPYDWSNL